MLRNSTTIHERTNIIRIPKSPLTKEENNNRQKEEVEYSLKENIFDPSQSSPPNDFMTKLELRMSKYFNK
jgi:hypothetical protein